MCASHWDRTKPRGAVKAWGSHGLTPRRAAKGGRPVVSRPERPASTPGAPRPRPQAHPERTRWDPKDGELCPARTKSGETLMEVRSDSDVQIDRQS